MPNDKSVSETKWRCCEGDGKGGMSQGGHAPTCENLRYETVRDERCLECSHLKAAHFSCEIGSFCKECPNVSNTWEHVYQAAPTTTGSAPARHVHTETRTVSVRVDVDKGIADAVIRLNKIEGIWTHSSCQGTIGEGGAEPYGPYVEVSWTSPEAFNAMREDFEVEVKGLSWGMATPKNCSECRKPVGSAPTAREFAETYEYTNLFDFAESYAQSWRERAEKAEAAVEHFLSECKRLGGDFEKWMSRAVAAEVALNEECKVNVARQQEISELRALAGEMAEVLELLVAPDDGILRAAEVKAEFAKSRAALKAWKKYIKK